MKDFDIPAFTKDPEVLALWKELKHEYMRPHLEEAARMEAKKASKKTSKEPSSKNSTGERNALLFAIGFIAFMFIFSH